MEPRYLIIGASGFVGARLHALLGHEKAVATYNHWPIVNGIHFDAVRDRLSEQVLRRYKKLTHAFIFHGITNIDACARDPEGTAKVNVDSIQNLITQLVDYGITPVFASSDAVFDGARGFWTETDPTNPILTYGHHKVQVEEFLMGRPFPYLIVRLSKVITSLPDQNDMLSAWMNALDKGLEIRCANDQIFSPVNVEDAVKALLTLVGIGATGLYHVCSLVPVSRLGLLKMLTAEVRRYRDFEARIMPCSIRDFDFAEPRPLDLSMSPAKLYARLGRSFDELKMVCRAAADARYGAAGKGGTGNN